MNLSLIDPFILAQDYPDALTGKVSESLKTLLLATPQLNVEGSGHAACIRFNRKGDFLAAGRVCIRFTSLHLITDDAGR